MKPTSIRLCQVSAEYPALKDFYVRQLGFDPAPSDHEEEGVLIEAGGSRLELWPASDAMPAGTMLQITVDDADAWAEQARANGAELHGPFEAHGERMYALTSPDGRPVTVQSTLSGE